MFPHAQGRLSAPPAWVRGAWSPHFHSLTAHFLSVLRPLASTDHPQQSRQTMMYDLCLLSSMSFSFFPLFLLYSPGRGQQVARPDGTHPPASSPARARRPRLPSVCPPLLGRHGGTRCAPRHWIKARTLGQWQRNVRARTGDATRCCGASLPSPTRTRVPYLLSICLDPSFWLG